MERLKLGGVAGRHEIPEVVGFVLDKVEDPGNINKITADVIASLDKQDLMTIWRKSPYFSEGMDSLSLGLVESYFLYALYFWSLIYLSTTSLLMLPREPR